MTVLKRLDLFSSITPEAEHKTIAGSLISLLSLGLLVFLVGWEFGVYRNQRLNSRAFVMNLDAYEANFEFDIELLKTGCEHVEIGFTAEYPDYKLHKEKKGKGCRFWGRGYIRSLDTQLAIVPSDLSTFMQLFGMAAGVGASMDLSHRINKFQFGLSTDAVAQLSRKFPEIRVTPLVGVEFNAPPDKGNHSVFYYEVNILIARVGEVHNVLYTYTKNTVQTWGSNVFLKFNLDFSPIAIDYSEGREGFADFLTYVCGIVGGVLSLVKIAYDVVGGMVGRRRPAVGLPAS